MAADPVHPPSISTARANVSWVLKCFHACRGHPPRRATFLACKRLRKGYVRINFKSKRSQLIEIRKQIKSFRKETNAEKFST